MAKLLVLILIGIISTFQVHAQQDFNSNYYDSLLVELKANPTVEDAKQFSKSYKNGVQKLIYTVVKFKNDSIDRYWHVGLHQKYFSNGQLSYCYEFDSLGHYIGDKMLYYYKDGTLALEYNLFNYSEGEFIQKIKKGYIVKPFNKAFKWYDTNGRIKVEKTWDIARNRKHTGITRIYQYSKKRTKVIEREYKMGKRISKRKYELD